MDDKLLTKLSQNFLEILNDNEYYDITIEVLQFYLIQNKSTWIEQNFNLVYHMSFENDYFLELQKFCMELISKKPEKIFKSLDFTSISEKSLISLIQNENLQMREVQIWEHVLKWGFAKNPELSSNNLASFSKDDFNTLKDTLQQCIPFIEFYNLTPKEFSDKVVPYKRILPKDLYKDLLKDFLDNDDYKLINKSKIRRTNAQIIEEEVHSKNIDSKIISYQHAELISKWIDKLEITDEVKNSYEFKLILRGSRDGFTPGIFHKICDNKTDTVSIIKVKDSNEILGGYNPIEWNVCYFLDPYGITKDSFIFSFKNKENIKDYILSRVKNESYAIDYWHNFGPSFGFRDLRLIGHNFYEESYCSKSSYEKSIRETEDKFSVEEYEVFQIIKD